MEVVDQTDGRKAEKVDEEVSFMLTNKSGGFCLLSHYPKSRFEGVFFREGNKVYKVIDSLRFGEHVTKIVNKLWTVSREKNHLVENFFIPLHSSSLLYELGEKTEFDLILDCKEVYDNREWGRSYAISKESNCIVIKFSKKNDDRDDNSAFDEEFDIYLAAYSNDIEYKPVEQWEKFFYELDKERDSLPFERHVFHACRLRCRDVVFAFSTEKKKAIKEAKYAWRNRKSLKKDKENHITSLIHRRIIKDDEVAVAYQCSLNAIDSLAVNDAGISAGLPWFFQFWARDELISLKALINMEKFSLAKKILFKYLDMIGPEGKILTKDTDQELKSADAALWLFKRFEDFIDALEEKGKTRKYLSRREMRKLREKLHTTVSQWMKYHQEDGLIINKAKETWMDTDWKGDNREGARIEINALFLACLRLLRKIDKKEPFEKELAETVKKIFFDRKILADGADDTTIRPNVFIAAYVYPELLSRKEWIKCFELMLPKLWLSWGGLSTIDKSNQLYCSNHTGELPKSYHRGDSWFWINNMAAIVLRRLDEKRFKKYIDKIVKASVKEMLYLGVTGYSAELSSAAELKSQGCFAQAWSSAMFIELIDELYQ